MPLLVSENQTVNDQIESDIVKKNLKDEKTIFLEDNDHISLPQTDDEIKQQSFNEDKFLKQK